MTASNFPNVLPVTLVYEGGFTIDRRDPGNWTGGKVGKGVLKGTKKGIAANSYPNLDIKNLTDDQIAQIYERDYWKKSGADKQANGLDLMTFDGAVNSGVSRGKSWLVTALTATTVPAQITKYADTRLGFLHRLGTFKTFGKGWTTRVAKCEAKAQKMWTASAVNKSAAPVPDAIRDRAVNDKLTLLSKEQKQKQAQKTTGAVAGVTASGPTAVAIDSSGGNHTLLFVFVGLAIVTAAIVGFIAWQHSVRAKALADEARA